MAKREAFLIYGAWQEPIMRLSNESKGMLLVALLEYHNFGREIDLPIDVQMAFLFMKKQMDMDAEKYQTTCAKRAESGRKGGITKQNKQMLANAKSAKQKQAKLADNDKEKDKDNNNTSVVVDGATTTANMSTAEIRQKLSHKFYVSGRSDAECRQALIAARTFKGRTIGRMANGEPADITLDGKEIWEFDREMDIAVGYRVWLERLLAQRDAIQEATK